MNVFKRIIPVTAVTLLLIGLAIVPAVALLSVGQSAPDFQLNDLSNNAHTLSAYRGKVVVIDFFTVSCSYCQDETTNKIVPLYNNYYSSDANVQFLSIEGSGADAATIQSGWAGKIPWPVLMNGQSAMTSYNVASVPTIYVVDRAGKVALAMEYPADTQKLKATIDQSITGGSPWSSVGGLLGAGTSPAACAQDANSLDVFVQGTNNALYHKHYASGSGWGAWGSLGGVLTSSPAAISRTAGKMDVFVRGTDGALWSKWTADGGTTWSAWYKIGGQLLNGTSPAAYQWGNAGIGVVATGMNRTLYHISYAGSGGGSWSSWQNLGGTLTSSPGATSSENGVIDVFVRGNDTAVWQREYSNSAWGPWVSLGGRLAANTGPAACSWGPGRVDVFAQGTDSALWHKWYSGGWQSWESLGGRLTSSPGAAAVLGWTRIDAFVRGTDGALWWNSYLNTA
jgi:thiol-disulfide isomerase/thioredoxin